MRAVPGPDRQRPGRAARSGRSAVLARPLWGRPDPRRADLRPVPGARLRRPVGGAPRGGGGAGGGSPRRDAFRVWPGPDGPGGRAAERGHPRGGPGIRFRPRRGGLWPSLSADPPAGRRGESGSHHHGRAWRTSLQRYVFRIDHAPRGARGRLSSAHREERQGMNRQLVIGPGAVSIALALVLSAGCGGKGEKDKKDASAPPPPAAVVVAPVVVRDVPVSKEWIGTTDGNVNAEIRPKVDGYLLRRSYPEGSLVRQGQLLFEIDPRQSQAALQQTQADLEQARANLAKAHQDVVRFQPLVAQKAISQQELDNALSAERAAKAAMDARQAAVHEARLTSNWARVTSPITGIAGVAQQQVGNLVSPTTVLTTVSQCDPIRVQYPLSETEYLHLQERLQKNPAAAREDNLELVLVDGSVFPHKGHVLFAGRQVDVKTGTISMVALFPNPGNELRPGQFAKVRAVTEVKKG